MPLYLIRNDITKVDTDAIVLPANKLLKKGDGTSNAIYQAAGEQQLENELKFRYPDGCRMGEAVITEGYKLPAKKIIHAVCPQWLGGNKGEAEFLYSAYAKALQLALENKIESIAFPLLSTGNYEYPRSEAINIANRAIMDFLKDNEMDVYMVFYGRDAIRDAGKIYGEIESFIDDNYVEAREVPLRRRTRGTSRDWYDQESDYQALKNKGSEDFAIGELDDLVNSKQETFHEMLFRLIEESGMKSSEIYKGANLSKQLFSKIKNYPEITPKKKTIIGFAIALKLDVNQTRQLLEKAGYSFTRNSKFDIIVEYFIQKKIYDYNKLNQALCDYGMTDDYIGYN